MVENLISKTVSRSEKKMIKPKLISFEIGKDKTTDRVKELIGLLHKYWAGQSVSMDELLLVGVPVGKRILPKIVEERGITEILKNIMSSSQNIKGFEVSGEINASNGGPSSVGAMAISLDNKQLFSGGKDGVIKITEVEKFLKTGGLKEKKARRAATETIEAEISGHERTVNGLVLSSTGQYLYSGDSRGNIKIIDLEAYQQATTPEGKKKAIRTIPAGNYGGWDVETVIVRSPDDKYLYSARGDGSVIMVELETFLRAETEEEREDEIITIAKSGWGGNERVYTMAVSPNGKYLSWGNTYGQVKIVNLKEFLTAETEKKREKTIKIFGEAVNCTISSVKFSPDGKYLGSIEGREKLTIIDVEAFMRAETEGRLLAAIDNIKSYRFSPAGKYLCVIDQAANLSLINLEAFPKAGEAKKEETATKTINLFVKEEEEYHIDLLAFSPDGRHLFYTSKRQYHTILRVIDLEKILKATTAKEKDSAIKKVDSGFGQGFSFGPLSSDGKYLYLTNGGQINILRIMRDEEDV